MKSSTNESAVIVELPPGEIEAHHHDPRWRLAKRIVSSKSLAKSALLSKFLLYVCDRQLSGKESEITEQRIGVQVFGRPVGYNAADDNIVRNYARLLRRRLDEYFDGEGKDEELRIAIPRGGYVPVFHRNPSNEGRALLNEEHHQDSPDPIVTFATPAVEAPVQEKPEETSVLSGYLKLAFLISLLALLTAGIFLYRQHRHSAAQAAELKMWKQLFTEDKDTFLVPSDSGFVILQNLTGALIPLGDYLKDNQPELQKSSAGIDSQALGALYSMRNTSVVDLNIATKISSLPEVVSNRLVVRYARELRLDDLKDSNAILLGSTYSNPWVELFQKDMNFQFSYQPHGLFSEILNKHPQGDEQAIYRNTANDSSHLTYAVVAFLPNLNGTGKVLILEGLTMAGTQAAADLVMNEDLMRPVLQKAAEGGQPMKSFELLVETRSFGDNAPRAQIIASRFYSSEKR